MGSNIIGMMDCSLEQNDALLQLPFWFEQWEQKFSRFRPSSELNFVNSRAGSTTIISDEFIEIMGIAQQAELVSHGIVKATLLQPLKRAGYDRSFDQMVETNAEPYKTPFTADSSIFEVELDLQQKSLCLSPDMQLDMGGFAKGWAATKAAKELGKIAPSLVSAGGDMYITGSLQNGDPWQVTIEDPFSPGEIMATLAINSGAIATSGTYRRNWTINGRKQHHLIDPRTGYPAQTDILSSTIICENPEIAEVAAKTTLILGSEKAAEWVNQQDNLSTFFILDDGKVVFNEKMQDYFWRNK